MDDDIYTQIEKSEFTLVKHSVVGCDPAILKFSRRKEHNKKPLALSSVINKVTSFLKATLPETIVIRQLIMADATNIHQVIMNLSTNAWHAMKETVFLPLLETQDDYQKNPDESILERGREKILFIDDEPALADVFKMAVEELGYEVHTETDPFQALEVFRDSSDSFDLVITEKTMPHMTGFDVAKNIRMIRSDIPIILCSGNHEKEDIDRMLSHGISKFVIKPIKIGAMSQAIREVLQ